MSEQATQPLLGFHFQPGSNLTNKHLFMLRFCRTGCSPSGNNSSYFEKKGLAVIPAAGPSTILGALLPHEIIYCANAAISSALRATS